MAFPFLQKSKSWLSQARSISRELKLLWRDSGFRWFTFGGVAINLITWLSALFIYRQAEEPVIALHHTVYFGINLIGEPYKVFALPLLGLGLIVANVLFAGLIFREGYFFTYLLAASSIVVNVFLLLGLGGIALVNF